MIDNDGEKKSFNGKWIEHGVYSDGHCINLLEYLTSSTEKSDPKVNIGYEIYVHLTFSFNELLFFIKL